MGYYSKRTKGHTKAGRKDPRYIEAFEWLRDMEYTVGEARYVASEAVEYLGKHPKASLQQAIRVSLEGEREMPKTKLNVEELSRVTKKLDYMGGMPFEGREHHVLIAELAKRDWRYLGRGQMPDAFLIKEHGLKDVHRTTVPFAKGRTDTFWVGKPTNERGKKDLIRLYTEKLPLIERETLPPDIKREYVKKPLVGKRATLVRRGTPRITPPTPKLRR